MPDVDIVTLAEVKQFLNIDGATHDTELPDYITSASQMIVNAIGPMNAEPRLQIFPSGQVLALALRSFPVIAVSSVTVNGDSLAESAYTLNEADGLITAPCGFGYGPVIVTYSAGRSVIPADIRHATLVLVKHLWATQRGGAMRGSSEPQPGSSYSMPNRVLEILNAYMQPGFA
jgi:hypothetical protein